MTTNWPRRVQSPNGILTFNRIDGPDDVWRWAIYTGDDGELGQPHYDSILMMFDEGYEPFEVELVTMLAALEKFHK